MWLVSEAWWPGLGSGGGSQGGGRGGGGGGGALEIKECFLCYLHILIKQFLHSSHTTAPNLSFPQLFVQTLVFVISLIYAV